MVDVDMDNVFAESSSHSIILRQLYGHRSCLLHVYLRKSTQGVLSENNVTHASRYISRSLCCRIIRSTFGLHEIDGLSSAELHYIGRYANVLLINFQSSLIIMHFSAQISATGWALFLPSVSTSVYFHRNVPIDDMGVDSKEEEKVALARAHQTGCKFAFQLLWSQCRRSYSNYTVQLWSVWYAVAMCGYLQVIAYIQVLWREIDSSPEV